MMTTGTTDTEMKAMLMSEEFAKMEEKLEKYKKEMNQYKVKSIKHQLMFQDKEQITLRRT